MKLFEKDLELCGLLLIAKNTAQFETVVLAYCCIFLTSKYFFFSNFRSLAIHKWPRIWKIFFLKLYVQKIQHYNSVKSLLPLHQCLFILEFITALGSLWSTMILRPWIFNNSFISCNSHRTVLITCSSAFEHILFWVDGFKHRLLAIGHCKNAQEFNLYHAIFSSKSCR